MTMKAEIQQMLREIVQFRNMVENQSVKVLWKEGPVTTDITDLKASYVNRHISTLEKLCEYTLLRFPTRTRSAKADIAGINRVGVPKIRKIRNLVAVALVAGMFGMGISYGDDCNELDRNLYCFVSNLSTN